MDKMEEAKLLKAMDALIHAHGQMFDAVVALASTMHIGGAVQDSVKDPLRKVLEDMTQAQEIVSELKSDGRRL